VVAGILQSLGIKNSVLDRHRQNTEARLLTVKTKEDPRLFRSLRRAAGGGAAVGQIQEVPVQPSKPGFIQFGRGAASGIGEVHEKHNSNVNPALLHPWKRKLRRDA